MIKRGLIVIILLLLNIAIAISVDYPTHSTLYTNEIKPVSDPPAGSNITASTTVTINAAGKITRFNYNGDYLDVDLGKFIVKSDGKVGIGTTNPGSYKLSVIGSQYIGGQFDVIGGISAGSYAGVNTPPSNGMIISGSVGIGTTTPGYKLDVAGTSHVTGASTLDSSLMFTQGSSARNVGVIGTYDPTRLAAVWAMGSSYQLGSGGTAGNLFGLSYSYEPDYGGAGNNPGAISGLGHQMQWRANGVTQTAIGTGIYTVGNVRGTGLCIGADCKTAWSQVGGTSQWLGTGNIYYSGGNVGIGTTNPIYRLQVADAMNGINGFWSPLSSGLVFGTIATAGTDDISIAPASLPVMVLKENGNIGIGTSTPTQKLDVAGYVKGMGVCISSDCRTSWPAVGTSQWTTFGSSIYYNTGNIGIGTSTPTQKLDVVGNVKGTGLCIGTDCKTAWSQVGQWMTWGTNVYYNGGNVGIGVASPGAKLEVAGQIKITGGTPVNGEVLTTDDSGFATWQPLGGSGTGIIYSHSGCTAGWTDGGDYYPGGSSANSVKHDVCYRTDAAYLVFYSIGCPVGWNDGGNYYPGGSSANSWNHYACYKLNRVLS